MSNEREVVQQEWVDADDQPQRVPDETVARVLAVMGEPPADLEDTAPVVTRRGRRTGLAGEVRLEDGGSARLDDIVPDDLPFGYHELVTDAGVVRRLVVSPGVCWVPPQQRWGWAVQLYAARSTGSAGVGDLADLRTLREWTESLGGGFLVVNPLHAVAPVLPLETSPYLPATRRFRNPVYLHVDEPPATPVEGIDRDAAWTHKLEVLRRDFAVRSDDAAFDAWRAESGSALEEFATWMVLAAEHGDDWHDWPEPLRDPRGDAVRRLAEERADEVTFQAWLQWLLSEQLRAATGDLTVVQDLPIGVSGGGADAWAWQGVMADGITVGCPPDALNSVGQDWGSPPFVPWRLRAADYEPFVQSVRATIAGAGGLRIDHVMGLFRLWWIPDGAGPQQGCYVRYPADDLLDIVCLESHRAEAVVVGEDLGTVEDGVRESLAERGILSYRVLWFDDDDPSSWPTGSLATVTTHDLPTVTGLWNGTDVDDQLESSDMAETDVRAGREELLGRLRRDGLAAGASSEEAVAAAYAQLGRAPSLLLSFSLEDAVGEERRTNVPGTTERDNWRVPLPVPVDELADHPGPAALLRAAGVLRPTRRRDDVVDLELVGGVEKRELFLADPDPAWADDYARHEVAVRAALGDVAVSVEHIGSTSVPGLAAKPIIDVLVTVPDITAEEDYLDPLLAAGYVLRVREPGHRLVRTPERDVHVHVLEPDDVAALDYLLLRDHLRVDEADRRLYEDTKRDLVARDWSDMNAYADAKTSVIEEIKARARSARTT